MNPEPSTHPTDRTLSAFGLGKLGDHDARAVGDHLNRCDACRQRVASLTADSFLGRVRGAGSSQTGVSRLGRSIPPPAADSLPPGLADNPDYEVLRELGRGGMGVVYLAHNTLMGRDEVLKVMGRHIMERSGVLERFLREIRAVARLRHDNIVSAYSASRVGDAVVFSMEYVDGLDLARLVKAKGTLPVTHACLFVRQAALGLQHAHEEGLVHRDIKPANLMLSRRGEKPVVKVLDFGLAKAAREERVDGALTSTGQALGTPDFIAPEQILDAPSADIRADIYSLGGTLYYLLTGRPPFKANSLYDLYQAHISRDADPLSVVRPDVPTELGALVAKMMAKEPSRRFQTPGEVAEALRPFSKRSEPRIPELSLTGDRTAVAAVPRPAATELASGVTAPAAFDTTHAMSRPGSSVASGETVLSTSGTVEIARKPRWHWPAAVAGLLLVGGLSAWVATAFRPEAPKSVTARPGPIAASGSAETGTLTPSGLRYRDLVEGQGDRPAVGYQCVVHYTGWLWADGRKGKEFDNTVARAAPLRFALNRGKVIRGFEEGVASMRVGGKRLLLVPPALAYGSGGAGDKIGPDATLLFEVELTGLEPITATGPVVDVQSLLAPKPAAAGTSEAAAAMQPTELVRGGHWEARGDLLVQTDAGAQFPFLMFGDERWTDYDFSAEFQRTGGVSDLSLVVRCTGEFDNARFAVSAKGDWKYAIIETVKPGDPPRWPKWAVYPISSGKWYEARVRVRGNRIESTLLDDNREVVRLALDDDKHPKGRVGFRTWYSAWQIRNIRVTDPAGKILWEGPPPPVAAAGSGR